jgi:PilZ domain
MSNDWQGEERRAHPRVSLKERESPSRVVASTIVDLSLSGALLEVAATLPTKSRYTVRLERADGEPLELAGEVVRSYVHGFEKDEKGLPAVKYRAAIQFLDVDPETKDDLERLLAPA